MVRELQRCLWEPSQAGHSHGFALLLSFSDTVRVILVLQMRGEVKELTALPRVIQPELVSYLQVCPASLQNKDKEGKQGECMSLVKLRKGTCD